jgi:hypothetical protein
VKLWTSVYPGLTGLLVLSTEWQVRAFLPSVGNLVFLLFGSSSRSEGFLAVRDSGECWASMLCRERSLLAPKNSKAWILRFTWVCGVRLLAPTSKLRVPVGQQNQQFLNRLVSTRQQRLWGLFVLGCGLPGTTAAATGAGDPSLKVA